MEREILFRGKRMDNGEWTYGSLLTYADGSCFICCEIYPGKLNKLQVNPSTVGQYTGLDGENGAIFEGDIVEFFGMRGVVVQGQGAFGIMCQKPIDYDLLESEIPYNNSANFCFNDNFISLWEIFWNFEQDDYPLFEVKVIGNRWDNQELLEVKE